MEPREAHVVNVALNSMQQNTLDTVGPEHPIAKTFRRYALGEDKKVERERRRGCRPDGSWYGPDGIEVFYDFKIFGLKHLLRMKPTEQYLVAEERRVAEEWNKKAREYAEKTKDLVPETANSDPNA